MRILAAIASGSCGLALLCSAQTAPAFCRATTCNPADPNANCSVDLAGCLQAGAPLVWPSSCLTVSVQGDAAPKQHIDFAQAKASVSRAFNAWTSADCGGKAPSIQVKVEGPITCDVSEYNRDRDRGNANIVLFREDVWPYPGGQDALGITFVTFDPTNGDIWDADIEINAVDEPLSSGDPNSSQVDLDSLLTHEVGHLLGLAHTRDPLATMFSGYEKGTTSLRSPEADDVSGLCAIYPPRRAVQSVECTPRHGYADACGSDQPKPAPDAIPESGGCSVASGARQAPSAWLFLACLALALMGRRLQTRIRLRFS